jgi:hypothetical protein
MSDRKNPVEDAPSAVAVRSFVVKHLPCLVVGWSTRTSTRGPIMVDGRTRVSGICHNTTRGFAVTVVARNEAVVSRFIAGTSKKTPLRLAG